MKVTVNERKSDKPITYPCLMEGKLNSLVVLFYTKCNGVVLIGSDNYNEGDYSHSWDINIFKPFHGTITLQND